MQKAYFHTRQGEWERDINFTKKSTLTNIVANDYRLVNGDGYAVALKIAPIERSVAVKCRKKEIQY